MGALFVNLTFMTVKNDDFTLVNFWCMNDSTHFAVISDGRNMSAMG